MSVKPLLLLLLVGKERKFSLNKTMYESIEPTVAAVDRDGKIVPTEYTKYNSR